MTETLSYLPLRDSYTAVPSYPVVEVMLESGIVRKRLDPLFATVVVTVSWGLTSPQDYTAFMGFFRTTLKNGHRSFFMDLVTDIGELTKHRCRSTEGMPKLNQVVGRTFSVSCNLEVQVNPTYTGLILYQEPNLVVFNNIDPRFVGPLQPGDFIRILNTAGTHPSSTELDLDGIYEVDDVSGTTQLELVSPATVNSDWTVLGTLGAPGQYGTALFGNVLSTVTRIPT